MGNSVAALDEKNSPEIYCHRCLPNIRNEVSQSQMVMAKAIAESQVAIQVAATRERLVWFVPMLVASCGFLYKGYQRTRSSVVLYPLIPMTFALFYQVDFAYGSKMERIKDLAENIMKKESHLLVVPDFRRLPRPIDTVVHTAPNATGLLNHSTHAEGSTSQIHIFPNSYREKFL